jgi:hypothetical protein
MQHLPPRNVRREQEKVAYAQDELQELGRRIERVRNLCDIAEEAIAIVEKPEQYKAILNKLISEIRKFV